MNQQPSVQLELERLLPDTRGGGKLKAESFRGLVQVNHLLPQQLIQILVLQYYLPQNKRLQRYVDQKVVQTPNVQVNLLFFPCKNPVASDLLLGLSMSIFKFGLP